MRLDPFPFWIGSTSYLQGRWGQVNEGPISLPAAWESHAAPEPCAAAVRVALLLTRDTPPDPDKWFGEIAALLR